jgi:preprotein translocase subunit SecA
MAQRDPLIEYQREGYDLFNAMMDAIKEESVGNLFHLQVEVQQNPIVGESGPDGEWASGAGHLLGAAPAADPAPLQARGAAPALAGPAARNASPRRPAPARTAPARTAPARTAAGGASAAQDEDAQDSVPAAFAPRGLGQPKRPGRLSYSAPSEDGSGQSVQSSGKAAATDFSKVGRNEPCPCGSGKKFKLCHGDPRNR